jgi:hypothetical protein
MRCPKLLLSLEVENFGQGFAMEKQASLGGGFQRTLARKPRPTLADQTDAPCPTLALANEGTHHGA